MAAVAWFDWRSRRIPNWWVVLGGLGALALTVPFGAGGSAAAGVAVAFGVGIVPFALRALGAGDVKASMVVGAIVGPTGIAAVLLSTALLCGGIAWIWWSVQRFRASDAPSTIPVGVPLAVATWGFTVVNWLP